MAPRILAYRVQYEDRTAGVVREYRLNSYDDGTLELLDGKSVSLKRIYCPEVSRVRLFQGSMVNVYGRSLEILEPADEGTKRYVAKSTSFGTATISLKSEALGPLLTALQEKFSSIRNLTATTENGSLTVAVTVYDATPNAQDKLRELNYESAPPPQQQKASFNPSEKATLCLVKPHVIADQKVGAVVSAISTAGFEIAAAKWIVLDANTTETFFAVYKGIWPRYEDIVTHFLDGPCLALQVNAAPTDLADQCCGPVDCDIAQKLRPTSIRALFGHNVVKNAIHATDMDDDGPLECHFFFNT